MKSKKEEQKPQTTTDALRVLPSMEEEQDKQPSTGEQLVKRTPVKNTPFLMITAKGETFGTLGNYRITEIFHNEKQCEAELRRMDWNNIVNVVSVLFEIMTKADNINTNK